MSEITPAIEAQAVNARWFPQVARQIEQRIVVEGTLELTTPAHFGSGDSDGIELLVLQDAHSGGPLLPGASITGALRDYLWKREKGHRVSRPGFGEPDNSGAALLFGQALKENEGIQSRVIVNDAFGTEPEQTVNARDGVKLRGDTGTAEDKKLYTFQVWPAGTAFNLRFELCLYAGDDATRIVQQFAAALDALGSGEIPVGARKHRGYGAVKVDTWHVRTYDLHTADGLIDWLTNGAKSFDQIQTASGKSVAEILGIQNDLGDARRYVQVHGTFRLQDSLLIRAGSDVVDMVHLHDPVSGKPLLSGTSLTGALRARALKIANTIKPEIAAALVDDLFGAFGEDTGANRSASRLLVKEVEVQNPAAFDLVQNRVKIDRFTGGAFDTGLFGQQPLFADDHTTVEINLTLRFPAEDSETDTARQAGLLLMLVKDLWTGDLPLGGESSVGRGRLTGEKVTVELRTAMNREAQMVTITAEGDGLMVDQAELLNEYVRALVE